MRPSLTKSSDFETQSRVFQLVRFEERYRKASFSWRIIVEGRPYRSNNAAFSNFSDVGVRNTGRIQYYNDLLLSDE